MKKSLMLKHIVVYYLCDGLEKPFIWSNFDIVYYKAAGFPGRKILFLLHTSHSQ